MNQKYWTVEKKRIMAFLPFSLQTLPKPRVTNNVKIIAT